jgi:hypothetical protein
VSRSQISIILSLFAVFGSGIVVGAIGYRSYTAKTVTATVNHAGKKDPEAWRREYVAEISRRLQLDPTQLGHLNGILDETRARFRALKDRHKLETDHVKAGQADEIRAMLTPAQKIEYEKFREERQKRMREQASKEQASK